MTLKEFFESKEKLCVNFKTQEQCGIFSREADKLGYRWSSHDSYLEENYWNDYEEETCYSNKCEYGYKAFYKKDGYKILNFEDIDWEEHKMKDKEYIDFMVIPYALPKVLLALNDEGVKDITVTQQDNDLHIRLDKDDVEEVVYNLKKVYKNDTCCNSGE